MQYEDIEKIAQINPECSLYMPPRNSKDPESYLPKDKVRKRIARSKMSADERRNEIQKSIERRINQVKFKSRVKL